MRATYLERLKPATLGPAIGYLFPWLLVLRYAFEYLPSLWLVLLFIPASLAMLQTVRHIAAGATLSAYVNCSNELMSLYLATSKRGVFPAPEPRLSLKFSPYGWHALFVGFPALVAAIVPLALFLTRSIGPVGPTNWLLASLALSLICYALTLRCTLRYAQKAYCEFVERGVEWMALVLERYIRDLETTSEKREARSGALVILRSGHPGWKQMGLKTRAIPHPHEDA